MHSAGAGQQTSKSGEAHQGNPSRWQARFRRIAVAATKQSLRAHGLQLGEVTPLEMWLPEIKAKSVALVAAAGAPEMLGSPAVQRKLSSLRDGDNVALIVGPQGDFTAAELDAIMTAGALPVGLGPNRLRVETAAVTLLAVASAFQRGCIPVSPTGS
mmetsp:Transcript_14169/g.42752  ORF Transcript_14169/g.42752 Transcript_14169/m.42752 type:complete len:157 (+) Transcript_14169:653-1123(+)